MPIVAGRVGNVATVTGVARGKITGDGENIVPPTIFAPSVPVHVGEDSILMLDTKLILFKHWTNVTNEIRIESISNFFLSFLTGGK